MLADKLKSRGAFDIDGQLLVILHAPLIRGK